MIAETTMKQTTLPALGLGIELTAKAMETARASSRSFASKMAALHDSIKSGAFRMVPAKMTATSVDGAHAVQMVDAGSDDLCRQLSNWAQ
jgi:hypothetical protein